ncbi:MAG: hypothetical protein NTZ05_22615 [Chloroflexi bacterium]|nr:hypothetical protein [Chloroflexota bacterium]
MMIDHERVDSRVSGPDGDLPPEVSEFYQAVGRYRAAQRRMVAGRCAVCRAEFVGTVLRRYCSRKCLVRAYRLRKAQH